MGNTDNDTSDADGHDDNDHSDKSDNDNDHSDHDNSDNDNSDNNDNDTNDTDNDNNDVDTNDVDVNDDRDGVSDLSAAILGSKAENDEQFNTNTATESDMQYYVKITLINMWLILGLIVVVNICFYWCYCRKTQQQNKRRTMKNNVFAQNDSSDAV